MALEDRFVGHTDSKIAGHEWGSAWVMRMTYDTTAGSYGLNIDRSTMISQFNLTGDEITDLDALITEYTSLSGIDKALWVLTMEATVDLLEKGRITKAQARTAMGL